LGEFIIIVSWFAVGGRWPASSLQEQELRAYREIERQNMNKALIDYLSICRQMGVVYLLLPPPPHMSNYLSLSCFWDFQKVDKTTKATCLAWKSFRTLFLSYDMIW